MTTLNHKQPAERFFKRVSDILITDRTFEMCFQIVFEYLDHKDKYLTGREIDARDPELTCYYSNSTACARLYCSKYF